MGLGASLTTFTAGTLMQSAQVNTNFSNLIASNAMTGTLTGNSTTATYASSAQVMQTNGGAQSLAITPVAFPSGSSTPANFATNLPGGVVQVLNVGGLQDINSNKMQSWSHWTGTGSGTYNHGVPGNQLPNMTKISPIQAAGQSSASNQGGTSSLSVYLSVTCTFQGAAALLN